LVLVDALQTPSLIYPSAYELRCWYENTGKEGEAVTLYKKAQDTIEQMATAVEDTALRDAFRQSDLVQAVNGCVARLGV
jgi:hypothetical protein